MDATLDHVVLEVTDVEASVRFYETVLGFAPVRWEEFRAGEAPFPSARVNADTLIDLFPPAMWGDPAARANPNHVCFTMSAAEAAAVERRLADAGTPIDRRSDRNYGARGWGRAYYFADPDGITLEVRHYEPE